MSPMRHQWKPRASTPPFHFHFPTAIYSERRKRRHWIGKPARRIAILNQPHAAAVFSHSKKSTVGRHVSSSAQPPWRELQPRLILTSPAKKLVTDPKGRTTKRQSYRHPTAGTDCSGAVAHGTFDVIFEKQSNKVQPASLSCPIAIVTTRTSLAPRKQLCSECDSKSLD